MWIAGRPVSNRRAHSAGFAGASGSGIIYRDCPAMQPWDGFELDATAPSHSSSSSFAVIDPANPHFQSGFEVDLPRGSPSG